MRESNFNFTAHNRACVCITSSLYDRRALDAPAASLPLVNSLTHLSYLTATSARIRESLSSDGGLERLVRILENCANPTALPASLADYKGKGKALPKPRKARTSPFKAFAEYDLLPSLEDLRELQSLGGGGGASTSNPLDSILPSLPQGVSLPPSLLLPPSLKSRHLLCTYTLAFQCIVNIGVRGSEAIRTRVVEAGALQVVVHVLERYLEEIERKRVKNQVEWQKAEQARVAQLQLSQVQAMMEGQEQLLEHEANEDRDRTVIVVDTSVSPVVNSQPSPTRPRLTRINIVAASSSAGAEALAPPSRVQTPDTVISNDDASLTGDDNGSSSGQETEEVTMSIVTSSSAEEQVAARLSIKAEGSRDSNDEELAPVSSVTDDNGDVTMSGPSSPVEERSEAEVEAQSGREEESEHREPTPRSTVQPNLLPAPTAIHRTPRTTNDSRGPRRTHHVPTPSVPHSTLASPTTTTTSTSEPIEGQLHFRDEDVLLALQLLAYLSKYPHVRNVFHSPSTSSLTACDDSDCDESDHHSHSHSHPHPHSHSLPHTRLHSINIFSLVELFTHRPPSDDPFTPRLSPEVQYWACTIMRNACRKDEQRGGIRQCANMNCGRWEAYAREFAKCRRCRRAKYCSKACQSASWGNGHKFWCHKQGSDERSSRRRTNDQDSSAAAAGAVDSTEISTPTNASSPPVPHPAAHRRRHRRTVEGDEDDEDDLPAPTRVVSVTGPGGVPTVRNRSGTITAQDHQHPLVQPGPLPGMEGQVEGGMPLTIDEDQIAREMMSMGDQEGVRIQDA
ncbi:MYND-type zinc finger protein MUB1 [Sporobolomyces salmoneus]|uniref:MYND-type zinc finger protein MUB1 n=1 Tax=Sporobolomyces salmoneus TaxID=183962 RepID=UPI00317FEAE9